ncbi:MAG: hypothetical protein Q4A93_01785 [Actinomycetota bacterium]|jgi:hypothetical protein|nr:hypothetical protein [Actinomycetota bacterium]
MDQATDPRASWDKAGPELLDKLVTTRDKLLDKLVELNQLEYHTCPRLEYEYQCKIGRHDYELFRVQTDLARVKRKVSFVKIALANGVSPDMPQITRVLDKEFGDSEQQLARHRTFLERLEHSKPPTVSAAQAAQIEEKHRELVERLHPDLNEQYATLRSRTYLQMVEAYRCYDYTRLCDVDAISRWMVSAQFSELNFTPSSPADLLAMYEVSIGFTQRTIDEVKGNYPYAQRALLDDEDRLAKSIEDMNSLIAEYRDEYAILEMELNMLLES